MSQFWLGLNYNKGEEKIFITTAYISILQSLTAIVRNKRLKAQLLFICG